MKSQLRGLKAKWAIPELATPIHVNPARPQNNNNNNNNNNNWVQNLNSLAFTVTNAVYYQKMANKMYLNGLWNFPEK